MKKINVGILGNGFIVPVFIDAAKRFPELHLRALWGRNSEKIKAYETDVDYVTDDLEKILNDDLIDVIYVALPNALHYSYARRALRHGKHVILEKPFTLHYEEAKKLIAYAKQKGLILYEAITTIHLPNYLKAKELVKELGDIRMVECNFSQYSRRYQRFKEGIVLPAFDKDLGGGALMDLNVYNIHFVTGFFGRPKKVQYFPNIEKGVDTSGVLILDYGRFKASLIASKDNGAERYTLIQGDEGYLHGLSSSSRCAYFLLKRNDGSETKLSGEDSEFTGFSHELKEFIRIYSERDFKKNEEYQAQTLNAAWVLEMAQKSVQ